MKMLTCLVSPCQTSPSGTSLICTTVPSAGERTSMCRSEPARCGSRKKLRRKRKTSARTAPGDPPLNEERRRREDRDGHDEDPPLGCQSYARHGTTIKAEILAAIARSPPGSRISDLGLLS